MTNWISSRASKLFKKRAEPKYMDLIEDASLTTVDDDNDDSQWTDFENVNTFNKIENCESQKGRRSAARQNTLPVGVLTTHQHSLIQNGSTTMDSTKYPNKHQRGSVFTFPSQVPAFTQVVMPNRSHPKRSLLQDYVIPVLNDNLTSSKCEDRKQPLLVNEWKISTRTKDDFDDQVFKKDLGSLHTHIDTALELAKQSSLGTEGNAKSLQDATVPGQNSYVQHITGILKMTTKSTVLTSRPSEAKFTKIVLPRRRNPNKPILCDYSIEHPKYITK